MESQEEIQRRKEIEDKFDLKVSALREKLRKESEERSRSSPDMSRQTNGEAPRHDLIHVEPSITKILIVSGDSDGKEKENQIKQQQPPPLPVEQPDLPKNVKFRNLIVRVAGLPLKVLTRNCLFCDDMHRDGNVCQEKFSQLVVRAHEYCVDKIVMMLCTLEGVKWSDSSSRDREWSVPDRLVEYYQNRLEVGVTTFSLSDYLIAYCFIELCDQRNRKCAGYIQRWEAFHHHVGAIEYKRCAGLTTQMRAFLGKSNSDDTDEETKNFFVKLLSKLGRLAKLSFDEIFDKCVKIAAWIKDHTVLTTTVITVGVSLVTGFAAWRYYEATRPTKESSQPKNSLVQLLGKIMLIVGGVSVVAVALEDLVGALALVNTIKGAIGLMELGVKYFSKDKITDDDFKNYSREDLKKLKDASDNMDQKRIDLGESFRDISDDELMTLTIKYKAFKAAKNDNIWSLPDILWGSWGFLKAITTTIVDFVKDRWKEIACVATISTLVAGCVITARLVWDKSVDLGMTLTEYLTQKGDEVFEILTSKVTGLFKSKDEVLVVRSPPKIKEHAPDEPAYWMDFHPHPRPVSAIRGEERPLEARASKTTESGKGDTMPQIVEVQTAPEPNQSRQSQSLQYPKSISNIKVGEGMILQPAYVDVKTEIIQGYKVLIAKTVESSYCGEDDEEIKIAYDNIQMIDHDCGCMLLTKQSECKYHYYKKMVVGAVCACGIAVIGAVSMFGLTLMSNERFASKVDALFEKGQKIGRGYKPPAKKKAQGDDYSEYWSRQSRGRSVNDIQSDISAVEDGAEEEDNYVDWQHDEQDAPTRPNRYYDRDVSDEEKGRRPGEQKPRARAMKVGIQLANTLEDPMHVRANAIEEMKAQEREVKGETNETKKPLEQILACRRPSYCPNPCCQKPPPPFPKGPVVLEAGAKPPPPKPPSRKQILLKKSAAKPSKIPIQTEERSTRNPLFAPVKLQGRTWKVWYPDGSFAGTAFRNRQFIGMMKHEWDPVAGVQSLLIEYQGKKIALGEPRWIEPGGDKGIQFDLPSEMNGAPAQVFATLPQIAKAIQEQARVMVFGYPEKDPKNEYQSVGQILTAETHDCGTDYGMSGAPVILASPQDGFRMVGIHKGRCADKSENTWVPLSAAFLEKFGSPLN